MHCMPRPCHAYMCGYHTSPSNAHMNNGLCCPQAGQRAKLAVSGVRTKKHAKKQAHREKMLVKHAEEQVAQAAAAAEASAAAAPEVKMGKASRVKKPKAQKAKAMQE